MSKLTTVWCDNCGACSDKVIIIVVRKKLRCWPCIVKKGLNNLYNEEPPDKMEKRIKKEMAATNERFRNEVNKS